MDWATSNTRKGGLAMTVNTGMHLLGSGVCVESFGDLRVAIADAAPWWEEPDR